MFPLFRLFSLSKIFFTQHIFAVFSILLLLLLQRLHLLLLLLFGLGAFFRVFKLELCSCFEFLSYKLKGVFLQKQSPPSPTFFLPLLSSLLTFTFLPLNHFSCLARRKKKLKENSRLKGKMSFFFPGHWGAKGEFERGGCYIGSTLNAPLWPPRTAAQQSHLLPIHWANARAQILGVIIKLNKNKCDFM